MGWSTHVIFTTNKTLKTGKLNGSAIEKFAQEKYNDDANLDGTPEVDSNGCVHIYVRRGREDEVLAIMKSIENIYGVKIQKVRVEQTDYIEVPKWRKIEDAYNEPLCKPKKPSAKKPSAKKPSAKKRSTKKRSTKKRSTKKRSTKKRSTKKRSTKKRSTKKRSTKKRSTKKRSKRK